jgi:murein DD-endopeptidase MepM/ murein hydrolase activator NlpD
MRVILRTALLWAPIFLLCVLPCFGGGVAKVSWSPQELRQGEVLFVQVKPETQVASVEGDLDGTPIFFYEQEGGGLAGIVGVDLATSPGQRYLRVTIKDPEGRSFERVFELQVQKVEFEVQRLTLPEEMVALKGEALQRVLEDNKKMLRIFNQVRPERLWRHPFVTPVEGPITSAFGLRRILNNEPRSPHSGVDIGAPEGTEVGACNDGIVVFVQELYLCGKTIIIDHGFGLYSMYFHLLETRVKEGDSVQVGDCIGLVGATGRVTGPHLHWGIRLLGARVDPHSLVRAVPPGG